MLHLQLSSRVQCRRLLTPVSTFLFKLVDSVSTRANMWCLHEAPQLVRTQHYACIRTCCQRSDTFGSLFSDAYRSDWTGDETIFAPATNCGAGQVSAIAIVRVSGSACSIVLKKVVKKHFTCFQNPRTAVFTQLHDPTTNVSIDQSVVIWFPAPNSYSGEDMCEFHVHGSPAIVSKLLQVLGEMPGLRPADAGEFTKRAVLNDKMNVLQAEALDCLIWSKTESQRKQALETLISDRIKAKYEKWADQLLRFVAYMEAYVEFGEDQLLDQERIQLQLSKLQELCAEIDRHLFSSAQKSDLIQNGLKVAIIGQPNVGKSSLLNQLCERELAIVSPISGTTRDVIEAQLNLDGYAVTLCDTAGIRAESRDPIEQEGINRARLRAKSADALIHVIDVNWLRKQNQMDFDLLENEFNQLLQNELMEKSSFDSKLKVIVINKCDLITSDQAQQLVQKLIANQPDRIVIPLSCTTGMNISGLIQTLSDNTQRLLQTSNEDGADTFVTARHRAHLGNTVQHLQRSIGLFESDCALAAFHLRQAIDELGRITGKVSVDQILDVIFKDFCIGK